MPTRTDTADGARELGRWNLPKSNPSERRPTHTERSAGLPHANAHRHGRRGSGTWPLGSSLSGIPNMPIWARMWMCVDVNDLTVSEGACKNSNDKRFNQLPLSLPSAPPAAPSPAASW